MNSRGRPKLKTVNLLDAMNLKYSRTQAVKSMKVNESTYNILHDIKTHNDNMKTFSDVIDELILIASSVGYDG